MSKTTKVELENMVEEMKKNIAEMELKARAKDEHIAMLKKERDKAKYDADSYLEQAVTASGYALIVSLPRLLANQKAKDGTINKKVQNRIKMAYKAIKDMGMYHVGIKVSNDIIVLGNAIWKKEISVTIKFGLDLIAMGRKEELVDAMHALEMEDAQPNAIYKTLYQMVLGKEYSKPLSAKAKAAIAKASKDKAKADADAAVEQMEQDATA